MLAPEFDFMEKVKDALFDSLALILGLEGDDAEKGIRFSWPSESGSEKFTATPTTDVCYIRVSVINTRPGTGYINARYEGIDSQSLQASQDMHIALRADYIFYGPHSFEHATRLYMMIHTQEAREILNSAHMAPIPHGETPTPMPELIDGNWYERHDAGIDYYMLVNYSGTVDGMVNTPEIVSVINE
jgi:hypothetical protein